MLQSRDWLVGFTEAPKPSDFSGRVLPDHQPPGRTGTVCCGPKFAAVADLESPLLARGIPPLETAVSAAHEGTLVPIVLNRRVPIPTGKAAFESKWVGRW